MGQKRDLDRLQEWGAEAAVIVLIGSIVGGVAIVMAAVARGESVTSAALPACGVVLTGGVVAFVIMRLRKQRERASRPAWMGHTQQWREEIHAKLEAKKEDKPGDRA